MFIPGSYNSVGLHFSSYTIIKKLLYSNCYASNDSNDSIFLVLQVFFSSHTSSCSSSLACPSSSWSSVWVSMEPQDPSPSGNAARFSKVHAHSNVFHSFFLNCGAYFGSCALIFDVTSVVFWNKSILQFQAMNNLYNCIITEPQSPFTCALIILFTYYSCNVYSLSLD